MDERRKNVVDRMKSSATKGGDANGRAEEQGQQPEGPSTQEMLEKAIRVGEASNESGQASLGQLNQQGETIRRANQGAQDAHDQIMLSKRTLRDIKQALCKEKIIKALILGTLIMMNLIVIYARWIKH